MKLRIWLTRMPVKLLLIRCSCICTKSARDLLRKLLLVQRMVNETEKSVKEDKEKRDTIDTKNQADLVTVERIGSSRGC
ncbi:putative heat shock protein 70 [Tanacetum coccineum]